MDKRLILIALVAVLIWPSFADEDKVLDAFIPCDENLFTESECQKWVKEMSSSLLIVKQKRGPFGLSQTPGVEVVKNIAPQQDNAFKNAIQVIPVSVVNASGGTFMVGANEFSKGATITIKDTEGKKFRAQVVSVKSSGILFKNVKTGERVSKNLTKDRGLGRFAPDKNMPGVVPNNSDHTPEIILDNN